MERGFQAFQAKFPGFLVPQANLSRDLEFRLPHLGRDYIIQSDNITPFLVMEVKFLQFIRTQKRYIFETIKRIYDEHFVDYILKIMLVHFVTHKDRLKVLHDFLERRCEIGALPTLLLDRFLKQ